jgi:hypothetical protein
MEHRATVPLPAVASIQNVPMIMPSQATPSVANIVLNILCPQSTRLTLPAVAIDPKNLAIVKLGKEEFACNCTTVPDPPARHFSNNISGLFEHWHRSDHLIVNGQGIPLKYWPKFYWAKKGFKAGAWKAIHVEWGNWKVTFRSISTHSRA